MTRLYVKLDDKRGIKNKEVEALVDFITKNKLNADAVRWIECNRKGETPPVPEGIREEFQRLVTNFRTDNGRLK